MLQLLCKFGVRIGFGLAMLAGVGAILVACNTTPAVSADKVAGSGQAVAAEVEAAPVPTLSVGTTSTQPPAADSPAAATPSTEAASPSPAAASSESNNAAALFNDIAKVLQHPRCMNCHVSGKSPTQGDERRIHMPAVERGADGRGVGMTCKICHSDKNGPVAPGAPDWRVAPLAMAWEGLSVAELCRAVTDTAKNGGRDTQALVKHFTEDLLVAWGWAPGGARKAVPVAKEEFIRQVQAWAQAGAACPN